jgi:hypothetical protein
MSRRVRVPALDDVTAVLAVGSGRPHELLALGQCLAECRA